MKYLKLKGNREVPRWLWITCVPLLCVGGLILAAHKSTIPIIVGILFILCGILGLFFGVRKRSID
jgi:hypothetical protein